MTPTVDRITALQALQAPEEADNVVAPRLAAEDAYTNIFDIIKTVRRAINVADNGFEMRLAVEDAGLEGAFTQNHMDAALVLLSYADHAHESSRELAGQEYEPIRIEDRMAAARIALRAVNLGLL